MGYLGYFYVETKSYEIRSGIGNGGFQLGEWSRGIFWSVVMSFHSVVWLLKMMEELMSGDSAMEFSRSHRVGDTVLVLQKRQNDFEMFVEITNYGGGKRRSYVIIREGRDGSRWNRVISQLRRLVKHVDQKGSASPKTVSTPAQPREVERGDRGRTFVEVVVGKGQTKEIEQRSEGGLGKSDQHPDKVTVDTRICAPVISAPADLAGQAGSCLAQTVMEGNIKALKGNSDFF